MKSVFIVSEIKRDIGFHTSFYVRIACKNKYYGAIFSQSSQIIGASGDLNGFYKILLFTHDSSVFQTDRQTEKRYQ